MHASVLQPTLPTLIQGGMGVGVSAWTLARAVSKTGQLGVVSGTALDVVLARRLQLGDLEGHVRRAMAAFPFPDMVDRLLDRYFVEGGKSPEKPFVSCPQATVEPSKLEMALMLVSNFVEVFLAKEGHDGLVGVNYLEKIQLPTLPSIYGAMLAGVNYVLMGAGIPRTIPGILDSLAKGEPVELTLAVTGADRDDRYVTRFDPADVTVGEVAELERPKFLAIVASTTLATMMTRKATGYVDGFVVEGPIAGGHNAPPRGALQLDDNGEPIYGDRDYVDSAAMVKIGRPFWLAGAYGSPERVAEALAAGAAGVQIGTPFAYCDESGLTAEVKRNVLKLSKQGQAEIFTDPVASPTGFPFKVVQYAGSMSEADVYEKRDRICDLGYLRHAYKKEDGTLGWRCQSEPVDKYVRKGGDEADTRGRKCICNGLFSSIGQAQVRSDGRSELPLVTSGDAVRTVAKFLPTADATSYRAIDVVEKLMSLCGKPTSSCDQTEASESVAARKPTKSRESLAAGS